MHVYRCRLPRWDAPGIPVFLTWRLWDSLPPERVFPKEKLASGETFVAFDRLLDTAGSGPTYLQQPPIATLVMKQLQQVCGGSLHAFVVMPNHVHLLCTPEQRLPELVRKLKGPTAFHANKLLGRDGKFWQPEYFDRMVRNDREFLQIQRYIEWNPVKAGLAGDPGDFQWSSAHRRGERGSSLARA